MKIIEPALQPGYAMRSTRRHPKDPDTVMIGQSEVEKAKYQGTAFIDGYANWDCWHIPKTRKAPGCYLFQYRPNHVPTSYIIECWRGFYVTEITDKTFTTCNDKKLAKVFSIPPEKLGIILTPKMRFHEAILIPEVEG